jgi:threonine synthase
MSWKDDKNKELFEGIKDDLIIYLKKGYFSSNSFINKLNLNVTNLEELIKLHFIFNESVVKFIDNLPTRIRNIKTSVEKKENLYKDVRGQIDWNQTINYRAKNNYLDQTNFICISNDRNYNITENIVLKRVLSVIDEILTVENEEAFDYTKQLVRKEGFFTGISSGANVAAALKAAKKYDNKKIVTVSPDSGWKYLSIVDY